jgi:hypothetical protein
MGIHATAFGPTLMNDSSGNQLSALTKTDSFDTAWYSTGGCSRIGIVVITTNSGGTSPTLDIDFEFSPDGGTTTVPIMGDAANSETQMAMAQITGDDQQMIWHECGYPAASRWRLEVTIGGTSETFDCTIYMFGIV